MAVSFNGSSDFIQLGGSNPPALDIANNAAMSIMCWVNFATLTPAAAEHFFSKGYDGTNIAYFMQVDPGSSGLVLGTFRPSANHGFTASFASVGIVANTWYHIYLDYSGTAWHWYLNGVSQGTSVDAVGPTSAVEPLGIGAIWFNSFWTGFFSGCIADAALFVGPLTGTEIANLGNGTLRPNTGMSKTLLGYWKLDTATGTQTDFSGNGNTGTATGTTTCGTSPTFAAAFTPPTFTQSPILQVRNRVLSY